MRKKSEIEYFKGIPFRKKYAHFPIKERVNVFNEGKFIWRKWYYEYWIDGKKYIEKCSNFKTLIRDL